MGGYRGAVAGLCSLALLLVAGVAGTSAARAAEGAGGGSSCVQVLERSRSGEAAVQALGTHLATAARSVGQSERGLRALLRHDPSLRVDRCARILFADPPVEGPAAGDAGTVSPESLSEDLPSGDAFALSSRPGSLRTIYLDFTGHLVTKTAWNDPADPASSIAAPPFDIEGGLDTFSSVELDTVKSVWLRVAEDFAPFNVNVTTAAPDDAALVRADETDLLYGARVVITSDIPMYQSCSCGGQAYVNVFDRADGGYYQPAFVYQAGAGASSKSLAELASHEVGHTLGLLHDGTALDPYYTGHGSWAPIMGSGLDRPVTQWSQGEYPGANNVEDDMSVMVGNGVTVVQDDHADEPSGATSVPPSTEVRGAITTRTDHDWFSVTLADAATTTVSVRPQSVGANLDVRVELVDAAGQVVAIADPVATSTSRDSVVGLDATIVESLAAGTYFMRVDGVGQGAPPADGYSDYASLGRYSVLVTTSSPAPAPTPTPSPTLTPTPTPVSPSPNPDPAPSAALVTSSPVAPAPASSAPAPAPAPAPESPPAISGAVAPSQQLAPTTRPLPAGLPVTKPVVYAASLRSAVAALPVRREVTTGWSAKSFTGTPRTRAVRTVPLAEAWASGGRTWTAARRLAFADDRANTGALRTASSQARADRDPADWLPTTRCGYIAAWTSVKLRWRLAVDRAEATALRRVAAQCPATQVTVVRT